MGLEGIYLDNLKTIQETAYLSTGNTPQYRRIMRSFFREYEKMHYQLYQEEVLELLRSYPGFEQYAIEQLKLDLNMLVEWKNLIPTQDPGRVYTIEDYKNKQFRYSMSERAVEIERMTIRLENLFVESGNLSSSYLLRIEKALSDCSHIATASMKEINEWWHNLQEDFKRLNQNYQDYMREFYSGRTEKILKSVEFILHKDQFILYLKEFIQEVQVNAFRLEGLLKNISQDVEQQILERVIKSEQNIPHANSTSHEVLEPYIRENVYGKWNALKRWFLSVDGKPSECSRVLDITDEIIRKIIQNAALIVQLQNWGISRKDDYKKFISMFLDCENIEEAHKLAAHIFGIQHIRHFKAISDRSTENINSSVYEEEPITFSLKPRTRTYRPRLDKSGFESKSMEKLVQRNAYLDNMEKDQKMVMRYIKGNTLNLADIHEVLPASARDTFLRWISIANMTNSHTSRTEYGQAFRLIRTGETCTLNCEDGMLIMPAYVFEFVEEKNASSTKSDDTVLDQ